MSGQPDSFPTKSGQWVHGDRNVVVQGLAAGASVKVVFGGQPRRVPLRPAVVPDRSATPSPAWSMRASSGALPFVDRDGLLTRLDTWMAGPQPFSTYLVGGRGGAGKTRLGVHLCSLAQEKEWVCGLLQDSAQQAGVEALAEVPNPRLVVVDYAETRAERLAVLLPILEDGASVEHPVRVLLLVRSGARDGDWRAGLRGHGEQLDAALNATEQQVLDDRPLMAEERVELFTITADAFARAEQPDLIPGMTSSALPALEEPAFATPLMVVIAAYLAVHGAADLPTTRQGLLAGLADHEDHHWDSACDEHKLVLDQPLRARIVALATLVGANSEGEAAGLLSLLPDFGDATAERRGRLARWAGSLYPGPRFWNPVEPDLLGEHLVTTHLSGYPGVLAGVLQPADPAALTQPLGLYARAAGDDPALATAVGPVLTHALPDLTRAATMQAATYTDLTLLLGATTITTALERAVSAIPVDPAALPEVLNALPQRPDLVLNPLTLTLTDQLVTSYRRLAQTHPATYEPSLAMALNNLSNCLRQAGRHREALTAIEEAVTTYRRLAQTNPTAHEPDLAGALNNLCNRLGQVGRYDDALTAADEAVTTYRRLAQNTPDVHEPDLAMALNNLSNHLSQVGRYDDALTAADEAVTTYRRLAQNTPDVHEPDLAMALNNLSNCLGQVGSHRQALTAIEEAVTTYRRLAQGNPAAYEPDLAGALINFSTCLSQVGRYDKALIAADETVTIYRSLVQANPAAYEPLLAEVLINLSNCLGDLGYHREAQRAREEAAEVRGRR